MKSLFVISLIVFSCLKIANGTILKPRIVNGYKAKLNQFPFYVFLDLIYPIYEDKEQDSCGSAIISDEWLITAGHCLSDAEKVIAHFGITRLKDISRPGHQAITITKENFQWHPHYIEFMSWNDIGLIRLPEKIEFSRNIQPINLPNTCESPEKIKVVTMGHGVINNSMNKPSNKLLFASMKTLSLYDCRTSYPFLTFRKSIICVQNEVKMQSVCKGDSGSPLIRIKKSNRTLIGIAVFTSEKGCEYGEPQGFTNLYSYLKWIEQLTGINLPSC